MKKKNTSSHASSNTPAIVGGVIGGVAVICSVIGIVLFVQRRRRRRKPISMIFDSAEDGPEVLVTPFKPFPSETVLDSGSGVEQPLLVPEVPDTEIVALHDLSYMPPAVFPRSRPVAPVPNGVSDKEIARLRAEALSSQQSHNRSTSNVSQSTYSRIDGSGSRGAASSYDPQTQRLQTEVESLRREMDQLRTEGLVIGAPPSYTEGDR